jgi:plastocyanin
MATITEPASPTAGDTSLRPTGTDPWVRLCAGSAAVVAAVDVIFLILVGEVIPPFAVSSLLIAVGIGLLRRRRKAGLIVLIAAAVMMLAGGAWAGYDHFFHPESGLDFIHGVTGLPGRLLMVAGGAAALRNAAPAPARRISTAAVGLLAVSIVVAGLATWTSSGDEAAPGDVVVPVEHATFPEETRVAAGGTLFVDNVDLFRHTYTVVGASIDQELPARHGTRIEADLSPGTYDVICAVPGHDFMESRLIVD